MTERAGPRASTVEFDSVTKRYDAGAKNTPGAVNDLSLEVPAGKILDVQLARGVDVESGRDERRHPRLELQ